MGTPSLQPHNATRRDSVCKALAGLARTYSVSGEETGEILSRLKRDGDASTIACGTTGCFVRSSSKAEDVMALFDDEPVKRLKGHEIGQDLSLLSVGELDERIGLLRAEIERLEAERQAKSTTKTAAEALFRR